MGIRVTDTDLRAEEAMVTVTEGTMVHTDEEGKKVTEEAFMAEKSSFELVRVRAKRYVSGDSRPRCGSRLPFSRCG